MPSTEENAEWIFKSYKQLVKISVAEHNYESAVEYLKKLVGVIPKINQNYVEESISRMLSNYSSNGDQEFISSFYDIILGCLTSSGSGNNGNGNGRRLWLKINMHKLNIQLENKNWDECTKLIAQINENLQTASELTRNAYSLELIAAEIVVYSHDDDANEQLAKNLLKLNGFYRRAMKITTAVTHPRIMGIIRQCGATIQFYRGNYEGARIELYESFKNYDEAGSSEKRKILKYLALCSLLTENQFNPFESQETQTYAQLPEYSLLIQLIKHYDDLNLIGFQEVMTKMDDPIVNDHIFKHSSSKILRHLRFNILTNIFKSYRRIRLLYLSDKLFISHLEVELMVIQGITLGKFSNLKVDFVDDFVEIQPEGVFHCIASTLDGTEILQNMKCLDAIEKKEEGNDRGSTEIENRSGNAVFEISTSNNSNRSNDGKSGVDTARGFGYNTFEKFIYQSERLNSEEKHVKLIDNWLRLLRSGIPKRIKEELTQKEQVILEQRVIGANMPVDGHPASNSANISGVNLSSFIPIKSGEDHTYNDEDEDEQLDSIDQMREWAKNIQKLIASDF